MTPLTYVGSRIEVRTDEGEAIEGWLIRELPNAVLVALDREGQSVRLVENAEVISYDWNDLAAFAIEGAEEMDRRLQELNDNLSHSMQRSLDRLDYRALRAFSKHAPTLRNEIRGILHRHRELDRSLPLDTPAAEFLAYSLARTDETVELHDRVFQELEQSEITDVLAEFGGDISRLPPEYALPSLDADFDSLSELRRDLELSREHRWTRSKHREAIDTAREVRARLLTKSFIASRRKPPGDKDREPKRKQGKEGGLFRWAGASLRILAGTALTVGNGSLGLTAGLLTTIASIGATSVPIYVAVATSVYTGLVQVADGLEKIAGIKED